MSLTHERIQEKLAEKFGAENLQWATHFGLLTVTVPKPWNLKVLQFLFDDEELGFRFLTDLSAVHYPDKKGAELTVFYLVHNMRANVRLRIQVEADIEKPDVFTATNIFPSANWLEREAYDFFGVNFVGHPDLRRIMNVDEMDYFPLRKEFPLEDQSRIDKDDEMFGRGGTLAY
jgi:NADH-quinone oxidoreductase subunit C